jgi:ATP-dependent Zn protease
MVTCVDELLKGTSCADLWLSDKPVAAGLDQSLLARQTSGFSSADLSNLVGSVRL